VHCYYTTGFLITLRRTASPGLEALRQASSVQPQLGSDPIRALHPLISSLYTQFSALALKLNERLDALEQRVLHEANDQELAEITAWRTYPRSGSPGPARPPPGPAHGAQACD
jgi:magnesium transporter